MLIYRYNRTGLEQIKKDIDKVIGQLKTLVKHQKKSIKAIQQTCLHMKAVNADDMDISSFYHAAHNIFKDIVEVKYDISLLTKYLEIIENYSELMESSCDINTDKFVSSDRLSKEVKEKFFKTLEMYSIEKFEDFRKFYKECYKEVK